jgi:hypothetical protein
VAGSSRQAIRAASAYITAETVYERRKPPSPSRTVARNGPATQESENNVRRELIVIAVRSEPWSAVRAYAKSCGRSDPAAAVAVTVRISRVR